jgi:hypothetical protein
VHPATARANCDAQAIQAARSALARGGAGGRGIRDGEARREEGRVARVVQQPRKVAPGGERGGRFMST